jgi:hypothetical protein
VASRAKYGCTRALVATNALFTAAAVELAEVNGVELWDRHRLAEELLVLGRSEREERPAPSVGARKPAAVPLGSAAPVAGAAGFKVAERVPEARATQSPPKCFKCGREMVLKENDRGKFWACPGFPKCRNTFPPRA